MLETPLGEGGLLTGTESIDMQSFQGKGETNGVRAGAGKARIGGAGPIRREFFQFIVESRLFEYVNLGPAIVKFLYAPCARVPPLAGKTDSP